MGLKREVTKRITRYMKSKGFTLSRGVYYYIRNDIAYCISLEVPTFCMYVEVFVVPLYVPCELLYLTYGNRVPVSSLRPITTDNTGEEIDKWCVSLCQYFEEKVFPFFEQVDSAENLIRYMDELDRAGSVLAKDICCAPVERDRLRLFAYLYLNNIPEARKCIDSCRKSLNEATYFALRVRKERSEEIDLIESLTQQDSLEIRKFCDQTIRNTIDCCF